MWKTPYDCHGQFKTYYKEIAEAVKSLRVDCGVFDASTILQER